MNFILRRFTTDSNSFNTMLGNSYTLIKKIDNKPDEWKRKLKLYWPDIKDERADRIIAIILTDKSFLIDAPCYIMTENGATFEKI